MMGFSVKRGTGKATCQLCKKKIEKSEWAVVYKKGFNNGQAHLVCLNQVVYRNTGEVV